VAFKTRHRPVPITPCRSASLLRPDVAQTQLAGKAYTLPRRHRPQPSTLQSFAGYSPSGAATPPLAATRLATAGDGSGGVAVWLGGEEDVNVVERLSPSSSAARCTCTMRRVVAATRSPAPAGVAVLRGLSAVDSPASFTTFKPTSASTTVAVDLPRSSVSDCATFYDRPLMVSGQRDDAGGGGTDYFPQCSRDRPAN